MRTLTLPTLLLALPATAAIATDLPAPGLYQIASQIVVRGNSAIQPAASHELCLTAPALADGSAYSPSPNPDECTVSGFTTTPKATYRFECRADAVALQGNASGTLGTDSFSFMLTGVLTNAQGNNDFRMSWRGKRLGECG